MRLNAVLPLLLLSTACATTAGSHAALDAEALRAQRAEQAIQEHQRSYEIAQARRERFIEDAHQALAALEARIDNLRTKGDAGMAESLQLEAQRDALAAQIDEASTKLGRKLAALESSIKAGLRDLDERCSKIESGMQMVQQVASRQRA